MFRKAKQESDEDSDISGSQQEAAVIEALEVPRYPRRARRRPIRYGAKSQW